MGDSGGEGERQKWEAVRQGSGKDDGVFDIKRPGGIHASVTFASIVSSHRAVARIYSAELHCHSTRGGNYNKGF